jgi:hypothetical protein
VCLSPGDPNAELVGPDSSPLEWLLAGRVAACWLQVQDAEYRFGSMVEAASYKEREFGLRRMESAQKRHLAAIKALAAIRKLARPPADETLAQ